MYEGFLNRPVICRSSASGVWFGVLRAVEQTGDTCCVQLDKGRRVWNWSGAGSCSGLAAEGPKAGKVAMPVDAVVSGVCEVLAATDAACHAFASIPDWSVR